MSAPKKSQAAKASELVKLRVTRAQKQSYIRAAGGKMMSRWAKQQLDRSATKIISS